MSHTTSDARKRAADGHQCCVHVPGLVEYADRLERQIVDAVPRLARSVDDLRVGMVVAWEDGGSWDADALYDHGDVSDFRSRWPGQVVILSDPPARDWLVPATQMEALREALEPRRVPGRDDAYDAARAVLDAAREVEHE